MFSFQIVRRDLLLGFAEKVVFLGMILRQSISLITVLIVLFGTIGIPVFRHTCLEENHTVQSLFVPSDHCKSDPCEDEKVESCCDLEIERAAEKDCCSDEVDSWRIPLSYFEYSDISLLLTAVLPTKQSLFGQYIGYQLLKEKVLIWRYETGPPLLVSERLPLICVWRL